MSTAEAAEALGISTVLVRRYCAEGRIVATRIGTTWVVDGDQLSDPATFKRGEGKSPNRGPNRKKKD